MYSQWHSDNQHRIDTLAFAYIEKFHNDNFEDEPNCKIDVRFPDKLEFAKDVVHEMTYEDEAGNSPLTEFLDEMMDEAVNQGSAGIDFPDLRGAEDGGEGFGGRAGLDGRTGFRLRVQTDELALANRGVQHEGFQSGVREDGH